MSDDLDDPVDDTILIESIEIARDNLRFPALRITPKTDDAIACNGAGVVVIAGEWGLGDSERARVIMPLAELGYFVVAFELVRDRLADEDVRRRASRIVHARAIDEIAAALLCLRPLARGKLGVVGLDAAGAITVEAATVLPQIDAVVHVGGRPPRPDARLERMRAALLIHHAQADAPIGDETFARMEQRIEPAYVPLFATYDYPVADGFFLRPRDADEEHHAIVAWDRTRDFLTETLT